MTASPGIRVIAAALALGLAPGLSPAQQTELVRLRAGEHPGFSRVVLDLSEIGDWSSVRDGRSLTLRFAGRDLQFDATQVHPARRAARVLRAEGERTGGDTVLTVALACDCPTNVFTLGPRKLVIDVRDEPPKPESPAEAPRADEASAAETEDAPVARAAPDDRGELVAAAAPSRPVSTPSAFKSPTTQITPPVLTPPIPTPPPAPEIAAAPPANAAAGVAPPGAAEVDAAEVDAAEVDVDAARLHLLEQLTRAAEQGLLEFRPTPPAPDGEAEAAAPDPAEAETEAAAGAVVDDTPTESAGPVPDGEAATNERRAAPEAPSGVAVSALTDSKSLGSDPQVSARSVFDRDAALARRDAGKAPDFCVSDRHLAISTWATDAPMTDQIPALRAGLLGEFDKVDGEAALALARLYIHFGFGVEADAVLRVLENSGASDAVKETATLLVDLARIVDGRDVAPDGPVARSVNCGGRIAAWRLAAGLGEAPQDTAALETLIATAPLHVRRMLAPQIVEALLDRGEIDAAGRVHALLARAEGDHGDAFHLAAARLAGAEGRIAASEGGYRALIAENSILTDRALLYLAESLLARGAPAPARLVGDLEAMAFLLRGTPLGRSLRVAEVRLRAGGGGLAPTMSRIELDMRTDPAAAEDLRRAAQDIWRAAGADGEVPAEYARSAIAYLPLVGETPEADPARMTAARELIGLGLPGPALDALAPPLSRGDADARLLAASAHLMLRDPPAALAALDGESGEGAEILRARAHAQAGAHPAAFATLAEVEGAEARSLRAAAAWRGGDWSAAAALEGDPDKRAMAAFMARNGRPIAGPARLSERLSADPSADGEEPAADSADAPRAAFAAGAGFTTAPSLRAAQDALDQAGSARGFIEEVLKDG